MRTKWQEFQELQSLEDEALRAETLPIVCDAQVRAFVWALDKIDATFEEARAEL